MLNLNLFINLNFKLVKYPKFKNLDIKTTQRAETLFFDDVISLYLEFKN